MHTCIVQSTYVYIYASFYLIVSASTSPALKHLQLFRKYIGEQWFDLGVELLDDRDVGDLDTIKQNYPHNTKKCCTEMFQLWLSRCTSASWDDFIYALQAIELNYVADEVSQFYGMYICIYYTMCSYIHIYGITKEMLW